MKREDEEKKMEQFVYKLNQGILEEKDCEEKYYSWRGDGLNELNIFHYCATFKMLHKLPPRCLTPKRVLREGLIMQCYGRMDEIPWAKFSPRVWAKFAQELEVFIESNAYTKKSELIRFVGKIKKLEKIKEEM